ncbi:hypothetical protein IIC44_01520 [Patescibacteria group bacterium]|nr:hypothetical protein [Patescibacteria group bacterium]
MARRKIEDRNIRSLSKTSGGRSYTITLPIEVIRRWRWKNRQKLQLKINEKTKTITIKDWKK